MSASESWVAKLDGADVWPLAALRLVPGLEVAEQPAGTWLRGPEWNEELAMSLRKVPGLRRFRLRAGNQLVAEGQRVPSELLPELSWSPLREKLTVALPPAAIAEHGLSSVTPRLVRSSAVESANALLADREQWRSFATTAAEVRLRSLRFAAAEDGRIWIEGLPVPALEGRRFFCRDGIAVPCGWNWSPAVDCQVMRRWLGLAGRDTGVALADGHWEIIKEEQFVAATRQAARLTAESAEP